MLEDYQKKHVTSELSSRNHTQNDCMKRRQLNGERITCAPCSTPTIAQIICFFRESNNKMPLSIQEPMSTPGPDTRFQISIHFPLF